MIAGFSRLLLITLGVLIWVFFVLISLRQISLGQTYAEYDHPLLKSPRWVIVTQATTPISLDSLNQSDSPEWIWHLPVQQAADGEWIILPRELLPQNAGPERLLLTEVLKAHPRRRYLIEVIARDGWQAKPLFDRILTGGLRDTIAITSPSQRLLANLRKTQAQWVTAMDHSSLLIGEFLATFDMQALATLGGDFALLTMADVKQEGFSRLQDELRRRRKKIILVDDGSAEFFSREKEINADGVMTSRPRDFQANSN